MQTFKFVILGGGMVAGYAAREFVECGLEPGQLAIISADGALPYERPPLSKGFLAGRDDDTSILINPEGFYRDHGIDVRLQTEVQRVDFDRRLLLARDGEICGYEKLLIASGARPRRLTVPGADLDGVLYLRSMDDSRRIRTAARPERRAVVIGGGFIGMEAAAVLAQRGLEVTMLVAEDRIWARLFTPEMSEFFRSYYEERGVKLITNVRIASLQGDTRVQGVSLASGELVGADLVVAGIGVVPETGMFEGTALVLRDGIVINEFLETGVENVYAAGDAVRYRDVLLGGDRRVEHWDNAVKQGQHAARAMAGAHLPFENVPYFFSDVFDLSWEFWGDSSVADGAFTRGEFDDRSFSVWWLKQGRLAAAFVMNRPDDERTAAERWVRTKAEPRF